MCTPRTRAYSTARKHVNELKSVCLCLSVLDHDQSERGRFSLHSTLLYITLTLDRQEYRSLCVCVCAEKVREYKLTVNCHATCPAMDSEMNSEK